MASCEICGSERVATRRSTSGGRTVNACDRCMKAAGLRPDLTSTGARPTDQVRTFGGYGGLGKVGKDIMVRGEKELADDWSKRVIEARRNRNIDQRGLARLISERVNVIQRIEKGQTVSDQIIKKLERALNIELMVEREPSETRALGSNAGRSMTLGDYLQDALRKE